eukprot:scaffold113969_cov27-Tisochrysis_lutea.AAC.2
MKRNKNTSLVHPARAPLACPWRPGPRDGSELPIRETRERVPRAQPRAWRASRAAAIFGAIFEYSFALGTGHGRIFTIHTCPTLIPHVLPLLMHLSAPAESRFAHSPALPVASSGHTVQVLTNVHGPPSPASLAYCPLPSLYTLIPSS